MAQRNDAEGTLVRRINKQNANYPFAPIKAIVVTQAERVELETQDSHSAFIEAKVESGMMVKFHTIAQMQSWMQANLPKDHSYAMLYK